MTSPSNSKSDEIFAWPATELLAAARDVENSNGTLEANANTDLVGLAMIINSARKVPAQVKLLGLFGRAYVKEIRGKEYLIFKGYAGLRPYLKGTKYLKSSAIVKTLVVGAKDIAKDARGGFALSFVCYTIIDITRELSSDHPSLLALGVNLTSDLLKCAVSTAAGAVAGVGLVLLVTGTPVVVAFVTVIVVGAVVGYALDVVDQNYHLTDRAREMIINYASSAKPEFSRLENYVKSSSLSLVRTGQQDVKKLYRNAASMLHDVL